MHAVRKGKWKLLNDASEVKRLYDLSVDPTEQFDLAVVNPSKVEELEVNYRAWRLGVGKTPFSRYRQRYSN